MGAICYTCHATLARLHHHFLGTYHRSNNTPHHSWTFIFLLPVCMVSSARNTSPHTTVRFTAGHPNCGATSRPNTLSQIFLVLVHICVSNNYVHFSYLSSEVCSFLTHIEPSFYKDIKVPLQTYVS